MAYSTTVFGAHSFSSKFDDWTKSLSFRALDRDEMTDRFRIKSFRKCVFIISIGLLSENASSVVNSPSPSPEKPICFRNLSTADNSSQSDWEASIKSKLLIALLVYFKQQKLKLYLSQDILNSSVKGTFEIAILTEARVQEHARIGDRSSKICGITYPILRMASSADFPICSSSSAFFVTPGSGTC